MTFKLVADTEEERKCISSGNQEDTCTDGHHDFLLEILLIARNALITNTNRGDKMAKETNWKHNFLKPQNANICLTPLNVGNNGIFHILSFCCVP